MPKKFTPDEPVETPANNPGDGDPIVERLKADYKKAGPNTAESVGGKAILAQLEKESGRVDRQGNPIK